MGDLKRFVFSCAHEEDEAEKILKAVVKLKEEGLRGDEIVVLVRNMALVFILKALRENGAQDVLIKNFLEIKDEKYEAVFMAGLEEGIFPQEGKETVEQIVEERKLFYGGVDAAKRILVFSYVGERLWFGEKRYPIRSRFIDEFLSIVKEGIH